MSAGAIRTARADGGVAPIVVRAAKDNGFHAAG